MPRPIQAFIGLMLFSAVTHLLILAIYFIKTHDDTPLNFFSIIGLDLFFPEIVTSRFSSLFSVITTVVVYSFLYLLFTNKNHHKNNF
jgi:predicted membrane protein